MAAGEHDERDDDAEDRAAILGRRALLVTGALAGVSTVALVEPAGALAQPHPCLAPPLSGRPQLPHPPDSSPQPCLRPPVLPPLANFVPRGRPATSVETVPEPIRRLCGRSAIYVGGGGAFWHPWRVVVDWSGSLRAAVGDRRAEPHTGAFASEWGTQLRPEELRALFALADEAWREPRASAELSPTWIYDEALALVDIDQGLFAVGVGPSLGGRATQELVRRMKELFARTRMPRMPR